MSTPWQYDPKTRIVSYKGTPLAEVLSPNKAGEADSDADFVGYTIADNLRNFNVYLGDEDASQ